MAWRVFSQKGLRTGVSSSPQHPGLSILGSTSTNPEQLKKDFGCCCNPCNVLYTDLDILFDATEIAAPGHECCDAEFCFFILDFDKTNETGQDHWIFLKRANLNSSFCASKNSPAEFDKIKVTEDIISEASRGKKTTECCYIKFLWIGAPFPNARPIPTEYGSENVNFEGKSWGPYKGLTGGEIAPRRAQRVHGDITQIIIYNAVSGEILKDERFNSNTAKVVDVCQCPEGFIKNSEGICVPA